MASRTVILNEALHLIRYNAGTPSIRGATAGPSSSNIRPRSLGDRRPLVRLFSTGGINLEQPAYRRPNVRAPPPPVNPLTLVNREIPFRSAQLVQPDNSLGSSESMSNILNSYSTETHKLIVVSVSPPIVKLINLAEDLKKKRAVEAKAKLRRKVAFEDKELQVSWGSGPGDLQHKVLSAKGMLEKGDRVQLVFAARKGGGGKSVEGGRITEERKREIVGMFDSALEQIGSRWREDKLEKGLWICFWGPKLEIRVAAKGKVLDKEVVKRQEKDEKKEARRKKQEERLRRSRGEGSTMGTDLKDSLEDML